MKVKTIGIATALLLAACTPHQNTGVCRGSIVKNCNPTFYFDFNSSKLGEYEKNGLNWVGKKLSKRENSKIVVTGYADMIGEDGVNMEISRQRAEAVKSFLTERHIKPNSIEVDYKGNRYASSDPDEQYLERRVEVSFMKKDPSWYDDVYSYFQNNYGYLFE